MVRKKRASYVITGYGTTAHGMAHELNISHVKPGK